MRAALWATSLLFLQAATAADPDTLCATLYTYLSQSARASGVSSSGFDNGTNKAQENYLSQNPQEDSQRYALQVIDGAQTIRAGVVQGSITTDELVTAATTCNARYFAQNQASNLLKSLQR